VAERPSHKLVVILHADVVGSTVLVQYDETLAHQRIQDSFRRFSETIEAYDGVTRELRGDALVAEFDHASDAVCAGIAFQADNAQINATLEDDVRPEVRIGISMGEVVIADNTVTGAGVVLAQRLEQLADPGGMCIQDAAYQSVPKRLPFEYESLGEQEVKGFEEPVRAYRVALKSGMSIPSPDLPSGTRETKSVWRRVAGAVVVLLIVVGGGFAWWQPWKPEFEPASVERMAFPLPDKPSIAVLPFTNMSGDAEQEYFVDGITEDLITDLSKLSGLRVVARNSTFTYKGQSPDLREVGRDLNVRYVLEGSVRKASGKLRITAQLVDASNGYHLWAERYDRNLEDIFALQDEVTQKIVTALSVTLTGQEKEQLARAATNNFEAYELFLRGQRYFRSLTKDDNALAQEMYKRAIGLDPTFARAYGALAVTYGVDIRRGWSNHPAETLDRALELAQKAVALDGSSPQVQWALGYVYLFKKQYQQAIDALQLAVRLAPNYADGYGLLALINNQLGQSEAEEAIRLIRKAMTLNPHYTFDYPYNLGRAYYTVGRYAEAVEALQEATERNEAALNPHLFLAASYVRLRQQDDAEWEIDQIDVLDPEYTISKYANTSRIRDKDQLNSLLNDLRRAGLPE